MSPQVWAVIFLLTDMFIDNMLLMNMRDHICKDGTVLKTRWRISHKAQRQKLSLSHKGVLEVALPRAVLINTARNLGHKIKRTATDAEVLAMPNVSMQLDNTAMAFIAEHLSWIESAAKRTRPEREAYEISRQAGLPQKIEFKLIGETWLVEYKHTEAKNISIRSDGMRKVDVFALKVSGKCDNDEYCRRALARFVLKYAKAKLLPFVYAICSEIGIQPRKVTINNRKSAWGVCTESGEIRVDCKLLFFPEYLARQVVLHETTHLEHMNHSQLFYHDLYSLPGSTRAAEKELKKAVKYVPAWFLDA